MALLAGRPTSAPGRPAVLNSPVVRSSVAAIRELDSRGARCDRWGCSHKMPACYKCKIGVKEAAEQDRRRPPCTDEECHGSSRCRPWSGGGWGFSNGSHCREDARPALSKHKATQRARAYLKKFMRSEFRFRPYAKVEPPNEDDNGKWDDSMFLERNEFGPDFIN